MKNKFKYNKLILILALCLPFANLIGQEKNKKFFWGASFYQNFSNIKNDDSVKYFRKPSVGIGLCAEYHFTKNIGINVGVNFMQRGAGIILPDSDKSVGNPDSTYRLRLRFNTIDLPINVFYKIPLTNTNKLIHLGIGVAPVYNFKTTRIFHSVEDGFHTIEDKTNNYYKTDIEFQASLGMDFIVSKQTTFQLHLIGSSGRKNIYVNDLNNGKSNFFGLKLTCLY
jgi:hypothetical protein